MYCFSQFCRLCVSTDQNLVNLFCVDDDLQTLSDKMRSLLPEIVYEEDNIPNLVCEKCCNNVKTMYEFKKRCLKNNEIIKLYASKLLSIKESPENINLEHELKLLQRRVAAENSDINLSLIYIKPEPPKPKTVEKVNNKTNENVILIKEEPQDPYIKTELVSENHNYNEQPLSYLKKSETVRDKNNSFLEPDLKLECTEEDDESLSEDQTEDQGDESMDCDEVISINDTDNENGDDDINIPEPMNLTAKALNNPLLEELDTSSSVLPPHLASGNREISWSLRAKNRCTYYGCNTKTNEKRHISMFSYPWKHRERLAIWLKNIGNSTLKTFSLRMLQQYYVCAKHFTPDSFSNPERNRLTHKAVPIPLLPEYDDVPDISLDNPQNSIAASYSSHPERVETEKYVMRPVIRPKITYTRKREPYEGKIKKERI